MAPHSPTAHLEEPQLTGQPRGPPDPATERQQLEGLLSTPKSHREWSALDFLLSCVQGHPFSLLAAHARKGRLWGKEEGHARGTEGHEALPMEVPAVWLTPHFLAVKRRSHAPENWELFWAPTSGLGSPTPRTHLGKQPNPARKPGSGLSHPTFTSKKAQTENSAPGYWHLQKKQSARGNGGQTHPGQLCPQPVPACVRMAMWPLPV